MTPHELLTKLTSYRGPCMRLCAYCPEDFVTAEVKECVENMIRENYKLRMELDQLHEKMNHLATAYREASGNEY